MLATIQRFPLKKNKNINKNILRKRIVLVDAGLKREKIILKLSEEERKKNFGRGKEIYRNPSTFFKIKSAGHSTGFHFKKIKIARIWVRGKTVTKNYVDT